jgi:hypothetical protein
LRLSGRPALDERNVGAVWPSPTSFDYCLAYQMIDLLAEIVELFLSAFGVVWGDTLEQQRKVRFTVATVTILGLVVNRSIDWKTDAALVVTCFAGLVAALVTAFSIVDMVRERSSISWLSIGASSLGLGAITLAAQMIFV